MLQYMLKSKIHRATVIEADLHYEGSLTVDRNLMDAVGLSPYERVNIYNINNGERFDTYLIEGQAGSGMIGLNGAAARKGMVGDLIIIVSFALYAPEELAGYKPRIVVLDKANQIKHEMQAEEAQHPYRG